MVISRVVDHSGNASYGNRGELPARVAVRRYGLQTQVLGALGSALQEDLAPDYYRITAVLSPKD